MQFKPKRPPKKLDAEQLWEYALRVLANRPHSVAELRTKMSRRALSPDLLSPALAKLAEYGLIDDAKFSQTYAALRLEGQGFGRGRVLRDLRAKRVAAPVAEQAVTEAFSSTDEEKLAEQYLQRRYRGKDLREFLKEEKNLAAAYRRLRTAGFNSAQTMAALKRFRGAVPEWEETEEEEADGENLPPD